MLEASSVLDRSSRQPRSIEVGSNYKVWRQFEGGDKIISAGAACDDYSRAASDRGNMVLSTCVSCAVLLNKGGFP